MNVIEKKAVLLCMINFDRRIKMPKKGKRKFISDVIGGDYKTWKPGDMIFITAPTGSGKSYFIQHQVVDWAFKNRKKILYFVNRRILKQQIEDELRMEVDNQLRHIYKTRWRGINNVITVRTYQSLEKQFLTNNIEEIMESFQQYDYVVCDEAHYFYADSNFNTYTEFGHDVIRHFFKTKIIIFISATLDNVKDIILERTVDTNQLISPICSADNMFHAQVGVSDSYMSSFKLKQYTAEKDYDYIALFPYRSLKQLENALIDKISRENEKWIIFTDSIDYGKKLQKTLLEKIEKLDRSDVVFIDANYGEDSEASESVNEAAERKLIGKRVTIATAVMDNGISLIDNELKNIVILADNEEEFLQMLGRKRKDHEKVNLYICGRDEGFFEKRYNVVENAIQFADKYGLEFKALHKRLKFNDSQPEEYEAYPFCDYVLYDDTRAYDFQKGYFLPLYGGRMLKKQQPILRKILTDKRTYMAASTMCYSVNGLLALNNFAYRRYSNLKAFYYEMKKAIQEDSEAFLKKQVEWLGKDEKELANAFHETDKTLEEVYREKLLEEIEKRVGIEMQSEQYLSWKGRISDYVLFFLKKGIKDKKISAKIESNIKKNDRVISRDNFNRCMEIAELPYEMEQEKKGPYVIKRTNQDPMK